MSSTIQGIETKDAREITKQLESKDNAKSRKKRKRSTTFKDSCTEERKMTTAGMNREENKLKYIKQKICAAEQVVCELLQSAVADVFRERNETCNDIGATSEGSRG